LESDRPDHLSCVVIVEEDRRSVRITEHLQHLRRSPEFRRAQVQGRTLEVLVSAVMNRVDLSGHDLAQAVYGRSDEQYVRAIRQVVRELRFKLLRHYEAHPSPIRFRIAENGYEVHIVEDPAPSAEPALPLAPQTTDPALPCITDGNGSVSLPPDCPVLLKRNGANGRSDEAAATSPVTSAPQQPFLLRPVVLAAIAVVVVIVALAMRPGLQALNGRRLDQPATIAVNDHRPIALDSAGRPLPGWTEILEETVVWPPVLPPEETGDDLLQGALAKRPGGDHLLALATCDPDRYRPCRLLTADPSDGTKLAELVVPVREDDSPLPPELHERPGDLLADDFRVRSFDLADLDGDGFRDEMLVALSHHGSFPTQVLGVDWDGDGGWRVLLDYWVMGHTTAVRIPDADGDRIDEVAAIGTFNGNNGSFFALLPAAEPHRAQPGRSPESVRPAVLTEVEHYPERGLFLCFPTTVLANSAFRDVYALRSYAVHLDWRPETAALRIVAQDRSRDSISGRQNEIEFLLPVDGRAPSARIVTYDHYLRELTTLIADGRIEDRWGVMTTQELSRFAAELSGQILMWDDRDPIPSWRPFDPASLAARFGTEETRRRSQPVEMRMR
jgi:hypothetical protein